MKRMRQKNKLRETQALPTSPKHSPSSHKNTSEPLGRPTIDTLDREIDRLDRHGRYRMLIGSLIFTATALFVLLGVLLGIGLVHGGSMSPAIKDSDFIVFSRFGAPRRDDIVLLHVDSDEYIKRVVGMPGDVIGMDESGNAIVVTESAEEVPEVPASQWQCGVTLPIKLAPGEYFVLGDNRDNSIDSRQYGPVPGSQIRGKVITVLRTLHISDKEEE